MGVMRFVVHPPELLSQWPESELAYITGFDGRVFPTRTEIRDGIFSCQRSFSDSGKVSVPWPVDGIGRPVLTTTSLRERDEPYILSLELARGKLAQVRDQWSAWEMARMTIPNSFREIQKQAFKAFAHASTTQHDLDECTKSAQTSIQKACEAADILSHAYVDQRMKSINRTSSHAPSLLGASMDSAVLSPTGSSIFLKTFNTASVPMKWIDIEPEEGNYQWQLTDELIAFCSQNKLITRGGPLINLEPGGLPQWLKCWAVDFLNLASFVCDFVDTVISRYTGIVRIWEVTSAGNIGGALDLNEEQCLSLVARTLEAAIRTDSDSQFFVRIEQPWGEYQRQGAHRLSPYQFVDALIRSNVGLSGVSLDINVGYSHRACFTRDMLSISKLIDTWSLLGLQIHVNLCCPSLASHDPLASPQVSVVNNALRDVWSEALQAEWMEQVIPLLMAKPAVTGVFLRQFSDEVPHRFPHAGILDSSGNPKQINESLQRQLRNNFNES